MIERAPRSSLRAPSVRLLLLGVLVLVLVIPLLVIGAGRVYETALIRHTEELLATEAVAVGEMYRSMLEPELARRLGPPAEEAQRFAPLSARLDLYDTPVLPPARRDGTASSTTSALGRRLSAALERSQVRTLAGLRVLDSEGRVMASPEWSFGYSLANLPEVREALSGRYGAALRQRHSDSPHPSIESISRTMRLRVSVAVPVLRDPRKTEGPPEEVLAVVYGSRTPLDLEKSIWQLRHELVLPIGLSLALTLLVAVLFGARIARPIERLRDQAERVAAGEETSLAVEGFAPAEVHALAASLDSMKRELAAKSQYVELFLANVVHELKSPLTSLRGAAEILIDGEGQVPPERARRFLDNIHEDALQMERLVGRILELARIETGRLPRTTVALDELVRERAARFEAREQTVATGPCERCEIEGVREQLEVMVDALLDNAVRHGRGRPVHVSLDRKEGAIRLAVRDEGGPSPPGHFDRVFERFYTTERQRGGTGLGLAIVSAVAAAHRGRCSVHATEEGATFIVTFTSGMRSPAPEAGE